MMYCSRDPNVALTWARLGFLGIAFIAVSNFYFNVRLLKIQGKEFLLASILICSVILAVLGQTPLIYRKTESFFWGHYPIAGSFYGLFIVLYVSTWFYGLRLLYQKMQERKNANDYLTYNQIKYVFIAWLGGSIGIVDFLPKYGIPIYPFAYIVALYWVLISAIAIMRYRLLADISFVSRRFLIGSAFGGAIASILATCYFMIQFITSRLVPINETLLLVIMSIFVGIMFQPLYRKVRGIIDRLFFHEYYERNEKLASLGQKISLANNSSEFHRIILESIFSSFRIVKASLFIQDENKQSYVLKSATGWKLDIHNNAMTRLTQEHPIPKYLYNHDYLLLDNVRRDFSESFDQRSLSLSLLELDATLCLPVRSETILLGFFVFGDKESGLPYSPDDFSTLKVLAQHTASAIVSLDLNKRWAEGFNQANMMDKLLHRYLSPSVADEVLRRVNQIQNWQGERRYVTVLIADIRGFTSLSESHPPEEVVQGLNEYLSEIIEIVMSHGGSVDKFMGDAVLVVFGAPVPLSDSEFRAVSCAVEMQRRLNTITQRRISENKIALDMGIGICAGDVVAGNIGSDKRMEYTVIGDPVNIAARLQSIAESGKILVTSNILEKVAGKVHFIKLYPIPIKGKAHPLEITEILGFRPKDATEQQNLDVIDLPLFSKEAS